MSSSTPSVKVNSRFLNPLLVLSAGVTRHVIGSVYQCPRSHRLRLAPAQPATCSSWPSDTSSNLATQIMLSRQRGGGWHMITGTHTRTLVDVEPLHWWEHFFWSKSAHLWPVGYFTVNKFCFVCFFLKWSHNIIFKLFDKKVNQTQTIDQCDIVTSITARVQSRGSALTIVRSLFQNHAVAMFHSRSRTVWLHHSSPTVFKGLLSLSVRHIPGLTEHRLNLFWLEWMNSLIQMLFTRYRDRLPLWSVWVAVPWFGHQGAETFTDSKYICIIPNKDNSEHFECYFMVVFPPSWWI